MSYRRRTAAAVTALLLPLGVPLAASAAAAAPRAAGSQAATDLRDLSTGFEQRQGASWTTFEEEQAYLAGLDAASTRVRITEIGRTAQGRPLQLVQMGAPRPVSQAQAARGRTVFFVCSQHGDEPAGREACLITMRELALTTDRELLRLLRATTVLFLPTANPDGRAANTRQNAAGVDVNRDHLQLQTNEGRAMSQVIRDWRPEVVHDLHEFGSRANYDRDFIHLWPRNLNVDDRVRAFGRSLSQDYVGPAVLEAGYTTGIYGLLYAGDEPYAQIAGDEDERIMRNLVGLRHSAGLLVESNTDPTSEPEKTNVALLQGRRVDTHLIGVQATLEFLRDNGVALQAATERSRRLAVAEGTAANTPMYWAGADNRVPTTAEVAFPPPCGYLVTAAQAASIRTQLDLHGIRSRTTGGDVYVSMAQDAEPVIPLLLDPRAKNELIPGRALTCAAAAALTFA